MRFNKRMSAPVLVCHASTPGACSAEERARFAELVRRGGEVDAHGLDGRILRANTLALLKQGDELAGIAAIKNPLPRYRRSAFMKAEAGLSDEEWCYELGWIFLVERMRGKGYSLKLVKCALDAVVGCRVFATSRTDNVAMHKTLAHFGFAQQGAAYPSERGDHQLALFLGPKPLK
jgi:predicted GNAT family N-acyltransferase